MDVESSKKLPDYNSFKRLIKLIAFAVSAIMISLYAWKSNSDYHLTLSTSDKNGIANVHALKEHAERAFSETEYILKGVADDIERTPSILNSDQSTLKLFLGRHLTRSPQIGSLVIINKEGLLYANSLPSIIKQTDVSDRDYFKYHAQNPGFEGFFVSSPIKSRINGKWRFTISHTLRGKDGRFNGLVAAAIDMDYFQKYYSSLNLGENSKILLIRNDGVLLLADPYSESNFSADFKKSLLVTTHLPKSSKGCYHIPKDKAILENDERLVAYESLENLPITAIVNQSVTSALRDWNSRALRDGLLILLGISTISLFSFTLIRQINKIESGRKKDIENQDEISKAAAAWRVTFDSVEDSVWVMGLDKKVQRCNKAAEKLFGIAIPDMLGKQCCEIAHPSKITLPTCPFNNMMATKQRASMELQIEDKWYKVSVDPIFSGSGDITGAVHIVSDITSIKQASEEREILEQKLAQSQKMEAIGHLAGGIAHDFNNILTPIMGYAEMAASEVPTTDPVAGKLAGILSAAHKARDLTHQLLSFSRKSASEKESLDLNEIILSINDILRRTIRENIKIEVNLTPDGSPIFVDRIKIEQILLNLTVNAQDAIGEKQGAIKISTNRLIMEGENALIYPGMVPGEHIQLSFTDTGSGMPKEVMEHIFEPFYTTKQAGHGTGLGLSTVYGILKQHDAFIGVDSRHGEGTTFRMFFPIDSKISKQQKQADSNDYQRKIGEGNIVLVEDNEMVRNMVSEMLTKSGYNASVFSDPLNALESLGSGDESIDLLISDVVMPGISGPEMYQKLLIARPELKVIFISGYPVNPALRGNTIEDTIKYLQKPFTAEALLERIRQVL